MITLCFWILGAGGGFRWEAASDRPFDGQIIYEGAPAECKIRVWHHAYCDQTANLPPILGQQQRRGQNLVFRPHFPFEPGSQFCVFLVGPDSEILDSWELELAAIKTAKTLLIDHWPDAKILPQNLLRFYLVFSQPMKREWSGEHVILFESGLPVEMAFVEIEGGLWNETATRLTLILHPGRVKRGVGPYQNLGPVLQTGHRYQLKIAGLQDAYGQEMEPWATDFIVGDPDYVSPNPAIWRLEVPSAESRDALFLTIPEEIDPFILMRSISVQGPREPVLGAVSIMGNQWVFTPLKAWPQGEFHLHFESILEDWSGNRPGRLFEASSPADLEKSPDLQFQIGKTI